MSPLSQNDRIRERIDAIRAALDLDVAPRDDLDYSLADVALWELEDAGIDPLELNRWNPDDGVFTRAATALSLLSPALRLISIVRGLPLPDDVMPSTLIREILTRQNACPPLPANQDVKPLDCEE